MLGDKIKELRKVNKVTQQQLADAIGFSRSAVGMLESNKNGASPDKLKELADFFGVTVDYLLTDDNSIKNKEHELISKNADIINFSKGEIILDKKMLGDRVKELRIRRNLTQKQLADDLNLSQSTIGMIESGKRDASNELLIKIANYFNCSTDYLLNIKDNKSAENKEQELITKYEDMPDFKNAEDAIKFILEQPMLMAYGGYDLKNMEEDEILEIANDMLLSLKISIERRKNKR